MSSVQGSSSGRNFPLTLGIGAAAAVGIYLFLRYTQSGTDQLSKIDSSRINLSPNDLSITTISSVATDRLEIDPALDPKKDLPRTDSGDSLGSNTTVETESVEEPIVLENESPLKELGSETIRFSTRHKIAPKKWTDADVDLYVRGGKDYQDREGNEFLHIAASAITNPKFFKAVVKKYAEDLGESVKKHLEHKNNEGKTPYQVAYKAQRGDQQSQYLGALREVGATPQR